jgi:phosphoribosylglycinamide formyltransferase 1
MSQHLLRVAVLASGSGSNFDALARDAAESGSRYTISLLVASNAAAGAIDRAHEHGIPSVVMDARSFSGPREFEQAMLDLLRKNKIELIVLAGYMRMLPASIVRAFTHRVLNVHPALLPAFGGKGYFGRHVHEAVLNHGARWTGATVHIVDTEYDTGPIVLQEPVPVEQDDTPESLARRVLTVEHRLLPRAVRLFAENRITIDGRRVRISERDASHHRTDSSKSGQ